MRRSPNKTVHVGPAWRLLMRDLGLDQGAILRRARVPLGVLDGEGSHIGVDAFYRLHDAVRDEARDPALALKAGTLMSLELFDPALFAALCSPDMNTAATRLGQFKRLVSPFALDVDIGAEQTRIGYRCRLRPDVPETLGLVELVFLVAFIRRATRHHVVPRSVAVQRLPAQPEPYAAFFGCALDAGERCAVTLSAEDARRPFMTHNAGMWRAFEPVLQQRVAQANARRSMGDQVEVALFELLPSGRTQLQDVAQALGLGLRTLQRRLADEDTSWLAVLNQTRERLAKHYLETTRLSPAEISFLLGFEDANSLFRAFHRWTGTTPESWRAATQPPG